MCQNYTEALESVTNWLMKFPKIDSFDRKSVESWKDLILLRLDGFNNDRIQRIIQNVVEIIGKDGDEINEDLGKTLFVTHALSELSRQQLFESVQYLSMQIRQKIKEVPQGSNYINLVQLATMFFVYSTSEEFYHALGHDDDVPLRHGTMEKLFSRPKPLDLPSRTGYLAASLYNSYLFFCNQEEFPPDKLNEAIKMMEMYLNDKSSSLNMICYTCDDEDTKDHEVFVCQGCRVVCYCCKGHQRLNYLHHENTGTRGLGHKHLCPVYKAFRKKRDNTDSSEDSHLERKFQRSCKRFFYSALNSIGKRLR
ncbi:predicted protein [Chaetoceros tenuissimus]|uniref:MYND-type domain-containing protein n=1 Tax=Chaetoceros tenuissimus TaxID=426638 RepID=A0AAD3H3X4_9STRA|nr:predicted protein [Chaetoceros tenuissimus]